jgi:uncharacterized membrane protein
LKKPTNWLVRVLWGVVIVLAFIGIAAAVRRTLILAQVMPSFDPPQAPAFDAGFAQYPILTLVHIVPGALFMILGPLQFVRRIRSRYLTVHRWCGRTFVASGYVIGITALAMSFLMSIGGANETAATTLFALLFLLALTRAFVHIRRREIAQHREWMIRAFAIGLAVATVRPIVGMFFALSGLSPREFFGIAFWLGFTLHLIAAEVWINYTRRSAQVSGRTQTL